MLWLADRPVLLFIGLYAGQRRVMLAVLAFCAFAAVMTPWVVAQLFGQRHAIRHGRLRHL